MPKIDIDKKRLKEEIGDIDDESLEREISFLGTDLEEFGEGIEVEIFPDRPDLLSFEGFARNLKSFIGNDTGLPTYTAESSEYVVNVDDSVEDVRPKTSCVVVKDVSLTQQLVDDIIDIQENLHVTYGRNRKKCAIGIYPAEQIEFPITYEARKPEEISFQPLGFEKEMSSTDILEEHEAGKKYSHLLKDKDRYPVFVDDTNSILSMPPIINSERVGSVDEQCNTLFIECSGFSQDVLDKAINMLCAALADKGATLHEVTVSYDEEYVTPKLDEETVTVKHDYIEKKIGIQLSQDDVVQSLERMNYDVNEDDNAYEVTVPCYRADILHTIDIVEDVCKGYKFYNIDGDDEANYTIGGRSDTTKAVSKIRDILIGNGVVETYSYNLINDEKQSQIFPDEDVVRTVNSVSERYNSLRSHLIVTLLNNLKENRNNRYPQKIFEVSPTFTKDSEEETNVAESTRLSVAFAIDEGGFTKVKGILKDLGLSLQKEFLVEESDKYIFMEGRGGSIVIDDEDVGLIGDINPEILSQFEIDIPVSFFEIDVDSIT